MDIEKKYSLLEILDLLMLSKYKFYLKIKKSHEENKA